MDIVFLVGRIIFGGYFVMSGFNHFKNLVGMSGYAASKGVPMPKALVTVTGLLLLLGGLYIVFGFLPTLGIGMLIVFLVPTTFMMHTFWKVEDPMARMGEQINFMKNLALIGALLMMLALPLPWMYSIVL